MKTPTQKREMSTSYTGRRAWRYNARWRTYSERALAEALAMIDVPALHEAPARLERAPRVLDVACGTGMLLQRLLAQWPGIDAYGVDASEGTLAQARIALKGQRLKRFTYSAQHQLSLSVTSGA